MCKTYLLHYSGDDCHRTNPGYVPEIRLIKCCSNDGGVACLEAEDEGPIFLAAPIPCPKHSTRIAALGAWIRHWEHILRTERRTVTWDMIQREREQGRVLHGMQPGTRIEKFRLLDPLVRERLGVFSRALMVDLVEEHSVAAAYY
jgi:hypothetical protein